MTLRRIAMPKLMEREDWTTVLESARRSNRVWCQRVVGSGGEAILALPEAGSFEVIFVEIPTPAERRRKTSANMTPLADSISVIRHPSG